MADRVRVEVQGGVADVRMVRVDKLNAIDAEMFSALVDAGRSLADDPAVRAVVLSGEGRAFCAGLDFSSFQAMTGDTRGERRRGVGGMLGRDEESPANPAQRAAWIWQEVPVPVIAAVHGAAYGGGLQIALGADLRYVAPDARLSVMEVKWGLIPDMSGTQTLRHLVGLDVAKELTFTGRVISGTEAGQLGLATRVVDEPREAALALAAEIASKSPDAIRAAKKLLNASVGSSLAEGLQLEAKLQGSLMGSPNQAEAVRSNLEKRDPKFQDPS